MRSPLFEKKRTMIKRQVLLLLSLCLFIGMSFVSCGDKIQVCSGKVKRLTDSTMIVTIDNHSVKFDMKNAEYSNGFVLVDDSVSIHYVGDFKEKNVRAVTVRIIPRSTVVDAVYDPSKELKTADRPLGEKASEDLEKLRRGNH